MREKSTSDSDGDGSYDFSNLVNDSVIKTTKTNLPDRDNKIKIEKSNMLVGTTFYGDMPNK